MFRSPMPRLPPCRTDLIRAQRFLRKHARRTMPLPATEASVFTILCCVAFFLGTFYIAAARRSYQTVTNRSAIRSGRPSSQRRYHLPWLNAISEPKGVVMSCPFGPSNTHHGSWKPSMMIDGVQAVVHQLQRFNSSLPLFLGYYSSDARRAERWCEDMTKKVSGAIRIVCFKIPERYPVGLYGYAKIFAIAHAPVEQVLWLDCDMYPVRPLEPLFEDEEFLKTSAMFWPDSRDHFDERKLESVLSDESTSKLFPLSSWWVRQGFDSGMLLLQKSECVNEIRSLCEIARDKSQKKLRALSLGDKDLFHVVWMIHNRNFTLVPWIGESGHLETGQSPQMGRRSQRRRRRFRPKHNDPSGWIMSSQLKFGRDGEVYALHQLHHYATGGRVKPKNIVKVDLRIMSGEDIRSIVESQTVTPILSPKWIEVAAKEMGRAWGEDRSRIGEIAKTIYEAHAERIRKEKEARLKRYANRGRHNSYLYRRLWEKTVHRMVYHKRNGSSLVVGDPQIAT